MNEKEYLDSLTEQIRNKRAQRLVSEEIKIHIREQVCSYMDEGMEEEQAKALAVRQMGDPVETGRKMNRIHRPQYPWGLLAFVLVLGAAGLVMQAVVFAQSEPGWLDGSAGPVRMIGYSLIGIGIMLLMMFADYTVPAQYAYVIYAGYMALYGIKAVFNLMDISNYYTDSLQVNSAMVILLPIVFCGIVYRNRNTGLRGMLRCLTLGLAPLAVHYFSVRDTVAYGAIAEAALIISAVLVIAAAKGIFGREKKKYVLLLAAVLTAVFGAGLLCLLFIKGNYIFYRIMQLCSSDYERNYQLLQVRDSVAHFTLLGTRSFYLDHATPDMYTTFVLNSIYSYFGILAGAVVTAAALAFAIGALIISLRQSSRIGFLTGTACSICLLVLTVQYIAMNFGYGLWYTSFMPFLSYGFLNMLISSIYVGLVLGVYRNSRILGEGKAAGLKAKKLRLVIETEEAGYH